MGKFCPKRILIRSYQSKLSVMSVSFALALTACNGAGEALNQNVEGDWVHSDSPISAPTDTPTSSPSSSPSPTATPSVTPTLSPTPSPSPSVSPSPSPSSSPVQVYTGPAEVEKYVTKFIADAVVQGVNVLPDMQNPKLQIQIASLDAYGSSTIGLCETGGGMRRVTFDPDFWNSVSEAQRELLAHHEFGHCVLYRGHRSTLLSSGAYGSIMYPIIMSSSTYTNNYDFYQEELFTSSLQAPPVEGDPVQVHICDIEGLTH